MSINKYLNIPQTQSGGNTGNPDYVIRPGLIKGAILTSKKKKYSQAEMSDFLTTLQADTLKTGSDRIYPIFEFKELSDKSTEAQKNTSGYGFSETTREGKNDWIFTMGANFGLYNNKQLRKLNGGSYRAFFIADNLIIGTQDSEGNFMGAELEEFRTAIWKANEGTKGSIFTCEFAVNDASELNDSVAVYTPSFDVKDSVLGCLNLELKSLSLASGKATIGIVTEGDQVNLYSAFSTKFADAAMWSVLNVTTGLIVAPTAVATNAAAQGWDLSLSAGTYQIGLVSPTALAAAEIGGAPDNGYEGIPIKVIVPGA